MNWKEETNPHKCTAAIQWGMDEMEIEKAPGQVPFEFRQQGDNLGLERLCRSYKCQRHVMLETEYLGGN